MRSPPGNLLYSDRLLFTIPHCLRIYGLIVTPGELGASHLTHWWVRACGKCRGTSGIGWGRTRLCTKMTKIYVFTRNRPWERFVKAPLVQHHVICKSATVAIYSYLSVNFLLDDNVVTLLVE